MRKLISCLLLMIVLAPACAVAAATDEPASKDKGKNKIRLPKIRLPRIDPKKEGKLKSPDTDVLVSITVRNRTKSAISLHWLDEWAGDRVHYEDIKAGADIVQQSWQGHYWIILDKNNKPLGIYEAPRRDGVIVIE